MLSPAQSGKEFHHKDTVQIYNSCHVPYIFTFSEAFPMDAIRKAAKANWYAKNEGFVFGKFLSSCPLNWRTTDDVGTKVVEAAVNCNFFPLYEIETW